MEILLAIVVLAVMGASLARTVRTLGNVSRLARTLSEDPTLLERRASSGEALPGEVAAAGPDPSERDEDFEELLRRIQESRRQAAAARATGLPGEAVRFERAGLRPLLVILALLVAFAFLRLAG